MLHHRYQRTPITLAAVALALLLHACGGGGSSEDDSVASKMTVNSPAALSQSSADNFDDNLNGVISGNTLKRWQADWNNARPAGISGKLVVLHVSAGPAGAEYVKPNGSTVFSYLSPSSEWIQTRDNGVIETPSMVPDGATMDALLKKYNIDASRDMIVVSMGTGSTSNAMGQGRVWYALRYWGVAAEHLALLNGGHQWLRTSEMSDANFQATASTAPGTGTFSVKNLLVDNTRLQATVQDLLAVLPGSDQALGGQGVFLWDARSLAQYSAGMMVERGEDTDSNTAGTQACASAYCQPADTSNYRWTFQNGGSRQGHPFGAVQLQYTNMLDSTKAFAYKPKAALQAYLTGAADANGMGFVGGTYAQLGTGKAYQEGDTIYVYCETTFRAMITGIASAVILGKPTRFYDGAMVEWNSLSNITDLSGKFILPADSPWRTDLRSYFRPAMSAAEVQTRNVSNAYGSSTRAVINADKAYKTGEAPATGSGSGGLPANPCGG